MSELIYSVTVPSYSQKDFSLGSETNSGSQTLGKEVFCIRNRYLDCGHPPASQ